VKFGLSAKPLSGRYLSFAEREEIALLGVQGYTMHEVARRLGRSTSTISRARGATPALVVAGSRIVRR
jgi:DNA-binding NarL/FixJ family response regulator